MNLQRRRRIEGALRQTAPNATMALTKTVTTAKMATLKLTRSRVLKSVHTHVRVPFVKPFYYIQQTSMLPTTLPMEHQYRIKSPARI